MATSGGPLQSIEIQLFTLYGGGVGAGLQCSDVSGSVALVGGGDRLLVANPGLSNGFFTISAGAGSASKLTGMLVPAGEVVPFSIGNDAIYTHGNGVCETGEETRLIFYRSKGGS